MPKILYKNSLNLYGKAYRIFDRLFSLARKPLAERVDKKLIAMDKKILLW